MSEHATTDCEVLIAGAGPSGLVLALWLTHQGVTVRIIDKTAAPATTSRAIAVQARTLELYAQVGLAEAMLDAGYRAPAANMWVAGSVAARLPIGEFGRGLTPYPFVFMLSQDRHEHLLIEALQARGVSVERGTELIAFAEAPIGINAQLRLADGTSSTCSARYLAGCDGAHSVVRNALGIGYPGGTYRQLFYVADVDAEGPASNGELHIDMDQADFLAVFPLAASGRVRLIGTVRDERAEHPQALTFDDVSTGAMQHLKLEVKRVNWFSTYRVHHRVSDHFRRGSAFLLGDAAHIHSPAGGQGMNTGIGDAINLAWKLAAVLQQRAPATLLDSYEDERIGFARRLVATTDRVFRYATAESRLANLLRTRLAPLLLPGITGIDVARQFLFRTVSQIGVGYRRGPLSVGHVGTVQGGDRLPWVAHAGIDNFASLKSMAWQVHVYGTASAELTAWCAANRLPLHTFAWDEAYATAGLARDAAYLLRPDCYIAVADPAGDPACLKEYAAARELELASTQTTASPRAT